MEFLQKACACLPNRSQVDELVTSPPGNVTRVHALGAGVTGDLARRRAALWCWEELF